MVGGRDLLIGKTKFKRGGIAMLGLMSARPCCIALLAMTGVPSRPAVFERRCGAPIAAESTLDAEVEALLSVFVPRKDEWDNVAKRALGIQDRLGNACDASLTASLQQTRGGKGMRATPPPLDLVEEELAPHASFMQPALDCDDDECEVPPELYNEDSIFT